MSITKKFVSIALPFVMALCLLTIRTPNYLSIVHSEGTSAWWIGDTEYTLEVGDDLKFEKLIDSEGGYGFYVECESDNENVAGVLRGEIWNPYQWGVHAYSVGTATICFSVATDIAQGFAVNINITVVDKINTTTTSAETTTTTTTTTASATTNTAATTIASTTTTTTSTSEPKLIPTSLIMAVGDENNLLILNKPSGTEIEWTSDNTKVATVSGGKVKAVSVGTATIYALCGDTLLECSVKVTDTDIEIAYGDANCNGTVEVADAVLILQAGANPDKYGESGSDENHITAQGLINADCSGGGDGVTSKDALTIQQFMLGLIAELPYNE